MDFNNYEKKNNFASIDSIMKKYNLNCILCNDIINVEPEKIEKISYVDTETYIEYFQYYVIPENDISYWDLVGHDIFYHHTLHIFFMGVPHIGTAWDYVLTDIPLVFDDSGLLEIDSNYIRDTLDFSLASKV